MADEKQEYAVAFTCAFCGNKWTEKFPVEIVHKTVGACSRCYPPSSKGAKVRYGAPERRPSAATYADFHLKRGEVYTIKRTKQWQHGCFVYLEGFDNQQFDLMIFVPERFMAGKTYRASSIGRNR